MKKLYKWEIPTLKWYEKLYMNFTKTDVREDGKHMIYSKMLGKREFMDRVRK